MAACVSPQARSRMFATHFAYHWPPRAVGTPRAFSAAAMSLSVIAPAFCASRMMGKTLAANLSAEAVTVPPPRFYGPRGALGYQGSPRVPLLPREPAGYECYISARSFSARAANRCRTNGSTSGPSSRWAPALDVRSGPLC